MSVSPGFCSYTALPEPYIYTNTLILFVFWNMHTILIYVEKSEKIRNSGCYKNCLCITVGDWLVCSFETDIESLNKGMASAEVQGYLPIFFKQRVELHFMR